MSFVTLTATILAVITVAGQAFLLLCVGVLLYEWWARRVSWLGVAIGRHGMGGALVVAMTAMLGSLFFSEIAHYGPCTLCWYQRIAMYPQVLLLGMAKVRRDMSVALYGIALAGVGAIIAGYHYLLQVDFMGMGSVGIVPCSATGYAVSCTTNFALTYGYISIPMMALTAFLLIVVLLVMGRRHV